MSHYIEYVPDPNYPDVPEDHEFNGAWVFTCDSLATEPCRWTSECDCEEWSGMEIAADGSSASHMHYDEDGEEFAVEMVLAPCSLIYWFDEDDGDWRDPARAGRQEITYEWEYDYYVFDYTEAQP